MPQYTIGEVIAKILEGWGIDVARIIAEAERIRQTFPDLDAQIGALEAVLMDILAPVLDVEKFKNLIRGIAADIMTGLTGTDPDAWRGSV